jgi:hypothetical protein
MNKLEFPVEAGLTVQLQRSDNDVAIKGWDRDTVELVLDGDADQCTVQESAQNLTIESQVALSISVPSTAAVLVGQVSGDLVLRDLSGDISIEAVHGEALVQSGLGAVSIQAIHGDLMVEQQRGPFSASEVHGDIRLSRMDAPVSLGTTQGDVRARAVHADLKMGTVSGEVRIRDIAGLVVLEAGQGDFRGTDLWGGMEVHAVKGDLSIKTTLTPGMTYRGRADGNIIARFPAATGARFTLEANGTLSAPLPQIDEQEPGRIVGQAGDAQARVELHARGDLSLKIRGHKERDEPGFEFDFNEDIAAQIEAQITERLGRIDVDALAQREIEKAMRRAEREIEKAQHRAEQETRHIQERMRRAQERAARAARRAQEKIVRKTRKWHRPSHTSFEFRTGQRAQPSGPSEEEQMAILQMLHEGKISVQEAEKLLKALE